MTRKLSERDDYLLKGLGYTLLAWISRLITHSDSSDLNLIIIFIFIGIISGLCAFINLFMGLSHLLWDFLHWIENLEKSPKKAKL